MKSGYLTESEIDEATIAIYNDAIPAIYEDIPNTMEELHNPKVVKELFEDKGIEYLRIPENEEYLITKQGRVFNSKGIRFVKPVITGSTMFIHIRGKRRVFEELFENHGWTFDIEEVVNNYKNNKWDAMIVGRGADWFE
jgi:hypothetical protein